MTVHAPTDADVSWWLNGVQLPSPEPTTFRKASVDMKDAGTYVVRAVKDGAQEIYAIPVTVAAAHHSISVELPQKLTGWSVGLSLVVTILIGGALVAAPFRRAFVLSTAGGGRADSSVIALAVTATGIVVLAAGTFLSALSGLSRARAKKPIKVEADGIDPVMVAKVAASVDRPRAAAALLVAGLLVLAIAAALTWRLT
jgi:hypothetical protein